MAPVALIQITFNVNINTYTSLLAKIFRSKESLSSSKNEFFLVFFSSSIHKQIRSSV